MNNLFTSSIFKYGLFVLSVSLLVSCGGGGGPDDTQPIEDTNVEDTNEITSGTNQPTGTITGNLQDSNGNPLPEVTLLSAGQLTKTDAVGNYSFDNISITGSDEDHLDIVVSIVPPDGYLGASISISPAADINNLSEVVSNTFVNNFIINTNTTTLPTLTQAVSGVLINNQTGEAISDVTVELEFINLFKESDPVNSVGLNTQYQTLAYTGIADINGNFSISDLPDDSSFRFKVEGHEVIGVDSTQPVDNFIDTYDRILPDVGALLVTPEANDVTPPYVVSVNDVLDHAVSTGVLSEGFDSTQGIVINFSEAISSNGIDANSVFVFDTTNSLFIDITSTAIADDGLSMVITTKTPIESNVTFNINMLGVEFQDLAGNSINTAPAGVLQDIAYDNFIGDVFRITLKVYTGNTGSSLTF